MDSEHAIKNLQQLFYYSNPANKLTKTELFYGVDLYYLNFGSNPMHLKHESFDNIVQINYCKTGQLRWKMKSRNSIYLNHGDFSLHTMKACTESLMEFPQGFYECLTICIDFEKLKTAPLQLFKNNYSLSFLYDKFCSGTKITSLASTRSTETIFESFYNLPTTNTLNFARLKFYELMILLENTEPDAAALLKEYTPDNVAIIQQVHDYLLQNTGKRITIEELARLYSMNTTSLKAAFKSIYGMSIGAYAKKQRLLYAARLLADSNLSIAEVAAASGYNSQSKFSAAFKALFNILPSDYRKTKNSGL